MLATALYKKGIPFSHGKGFQFVFLLFNVMIFTKMLCYMLYCMLFLLFPPPFSLTTSRCLSVIKSSTLDVSFCLLLLTGPRQYVHHDAIFRSKNYVRLQIFVWYNVLRSDTQLKPVGKKQTNNPLKCDAIFLPALISLGEGVRLNLHAPTGSQPSELNSRFPVAWSD